ncbi:MAG TPA: alpha-hydroxy acid oxidase [Xanthobacteraceae bacterium]|nr:alpha-hydroxy acid oxidase [Xanthobacteraceae bacterium]
MQPITNVEDLRELARRRVPRMFLDYAESGSYAEETLRANRQDLEAIKFKQKILIDVSKRSTATKFLGKEAALPLALAPVGLCGMQRGNGEILSAKAAAKAGIPFCLSTMSVCSIEDVAEDVNEPFWFQLYVMRDRKFARSLIDRAAAAKCSALVLTVDLQVLGQRHRDIKNGLSVPPKMKIANLIDIATKPGWIASILTAKRRTFGNIVGHVEGVADTSSLGEWVQNQFDPALNWADVKWIREVWKGPLVLKGILEIDDAKLAVAHGADAIVVSNHGGRQLDGAPSSISALPKVAEAVGNKVEVLFDGGVRSGQDVMRALALGAKACLIGRAYIYGLGALGEAGVAEAIGCIRRELETTMALTGINKVSEIGPGVIAG